MIFLRSCLRPHTLEVALSRATGDWVKALAVGRETPRAVLLGVRRERSTRRR